MSMVQSLERRREITRSAVKRYPVHPAIKREGERNRLRVWCSGFSREAMESLREYLNSRAVTT